jgi:hypothetical protein
MLCSWIRGLGRLIVHVDLNMKSNQTSEIPIFGRCGTGGGWRDLGPAVLRPNTTD